MIQCTHYRDGDEGWSARGEKRVGSKQTGIPASLRSPAELVVHVFPDCPANNVLLCSKQKNKQTNEKQPKKTSVLFLTWENAEIYRKK